MFAAALFGAPDAAGKASADAKLRDAAPGLAKRPSRANHGTRGRLRVQVNGIPDSLIRQLMLALARAAEQAALPQPLVKRIQAAARPGTRMDHVIDLIIQTRSAWANTGGGGLLIELDELGKLLELEAQGAVAAKNYSSSWRGAVPLLRHNTRARPAASAGEDQEPSAMAIGSGCLGLGCFQRGRGRRDFEKTDRSPSMSTLSTELPETPACRGSPAGVPTLQPKSASRLSALRMRSDQRRKVSLSAASMRCRTRSTASAPNFFSMSHSSRSASPSR